MNKLKSKRGITLIALIITIIILLILAMVTINILINQGIIGHANNAVRGYEVAEEKELIGLGYQNYKMDKLNDSNAELTVDGATVAKDDEVNGWYITFTKTKHNYSLSDNGTIEETGERWVKDGDTFKLGDATVKVGDYIAYDPTKDANGNPVAVQSYTSYSEENASTDKNNGRTSGYTSDQTFNVNNYRNGWRVLGIENGKIQLISSTSVGSLYLSGQKGYQYAEDELNAISSIYGQGKNAENARSISVEDVNHITGYNPEKTGNGTPYRAQYSVTYGTEVDFYWVGNQNPYYGYASGEQEIIQSMYVHGNGFYWNDKNGIHHSEVSATASNTDAGREKITALKTTYYEYYLTTLTESNSGNTKGIKTNSNEYKILNRSSWLSSCCVYFRTDYVRFTIHRLSGDKVDGGLLLNSYGTEYSNGNGVCPIVTLSTSAKIKTDGTNDGSTQAKAYTIELDS